MSRIVLPGDFITDNFLIISTQAPKLVGYGLEKREDGIYAVNAGILHESDNKLWLNTSMKRYIPHSGDRVLGTITAKVGDIFRVDIGGPDLALLNYTSFEGATKRNRPNAKVGDLIYGQIILTSKHFEPELSCVDSESRARGMGVISTPGLVFSVPLNHARKLLSATDQLIFDLGKEFKVEITVGHNGRIWVGGEYSTVIAVQRIIVDSETTFSSNIPLLIKNALHGVVKNSDEINQNSEKEKSTRKQHNSMDIS